MLTPVNDIEEMMPAQTCEVVYDDLTLNQLGIDGIIDLAIPSLKGMAETGVRHFVFVIRPKDK